MERDIVADHTGQVKESVQTMEKILSFFICMAFSLAACQDGTVGPGKKDGEVTTPDAGLDAPDGADGAGDFSTDGGGDGDGHVTIDYDLPADNDNPFDYPIWHPEALWNKDPVRVVGAGTFGFLDGRADEVMSYGHAVTTSPIAYLPGNGPYGLTMYESSSGRHMLVAGASRGCFDGPIGRARLGGFDYSHRARSALSPSRRYFYWTEPYCNHALRRLDLAEQVITTVSLPYTGISGMAGAEGDDIVIVFRDRLAFLNAQGQLHGEVALDLQVDPYNVTFPLKVAYDDVHRRAYCSVYGSQGWYVWYWDAADGSFHGVLAKPKDGEPARVKDECGPFQGTTLYGEMGYVFFHRDDPERRFLYVSPIDTNTFFRLDLAEQWVWGASKEADGVRFIDAGKPKQFEGYTWMSLDGNIETNVMFWNGEQLIHYRRVR